MNPCIRQSHRSCNTQRQNSRARRHAGFTLVEVMATVLLMAIVMPSIMQGFDLAGKAAQMARRRTEASMLAQGQLARIMAEQSFHNNGNMQGTFTVIASDGDPNQAYSWSLNVIPWPNDITDLGVQELDLQVQWHEGNKTESVMVSSLAYPRGNNSGTTTGTP